MGTQSTWGIFKLNNLFIMVAFTKLTTGTVCGVGSKVTLTGNVGNTWATTAITKVATAVLTKSDGYQIKVAFSGNTQTALTTENLVCNTYKTITEGGVIGTSTQKASWVAHATWKLVGGAALAAAGTAITVVDTSLVMVPNCIKTTFVAATDTGCLAATGSAVTFVQTITYFQPKEDAKKVYANLPRYYKGQSVSMYGPDATTNANFAICGAAATLTGASALVAGAAVAFGAAALAF